MARFAVRRRRGARPGEGALAPGLAPDGSDLTELPATLRLGLPPRFEAIAEALAAGVPSLDACAETGRALAQDGASLDEALAALRTTYQAVLGRDPAYDDLQALSVAWAESTLSYLHGMSCEDPMTGLASLAHVRSRLAELYRGELRESGSVGESHALVVVDLPHDRHGLRASTVLGPRYDTFTRALRMAQLGEVTRTVFAGSETLGRAGLNRVVVVACRDSRLGRRIALLRGLLEDLDLDGHRPRVWIEGLPSTDQGATRLLDELSRP